MGCGRRISVSCDWVLVLTVGLEIRHELAFMDILGSVALRVSGLAKTLTCWSTKKWLHCQDYLLPGRIPTRWKGNALELQVASSSSRVVDFAALHARARVAKVDSRGASDYCNGPDRLRWSQHGSAPAFVEEVVGTTLSHSAASALDVGPKRRAAVDVQSAVQWFIPSSTRCPAPSPPALSIRPLPVACLR